MEQHRHALVAHSRQQSGPKAKKEKQILETATLIQQSGTVSGLLPHRPCVVLSLHAVGRKPQRLDDAWLEGWSGHFGPQKVHS